MKYAKKGALFEKTRRRTRWKVLALATLTIYFIARLRSNFVDPAEIVEGIVDINRVRALWQPDYHFNLTTPAPSRLGATNDTLGFQHIFVIGANGRSNLRFYQQAMANRSGLQLTFLPDVMQRVTGPEEEVVLISAKQQQQMRLLFAHELAWELIIQNNLGSVLILDQDVDYDVLVRLQIGSIVASFNNLLRLDGDIDMSEVVDARDPHLSRHWTAIFFGLEKEEMEEEHIVRFSDYTLPSFDPAKNDGPFTMADFIYQYVQRVDQTKEVYNKRFVQAAVNPNGINAYAMTLHGARSYLNYCKNTPLCTSLDAVFNSTTDTDDGNVFNSFSVLPPLFGRFNAEDVQRAAVPRAQAASMSGIPVAGGNNVKTSVLVRTLQSHMLQAAEL